MLRIRLVNDLPPIVIRSSPDPNFPHHFNTTNLHTHGLHVSPSGIADNMLREMEPGQAYEIEVPIPANHPRGTYWYHPHRHGSANVQVAGGMAGALILEGDFDAVPEIAQARERVLLDPADGLRRFGTVEHFETVWPMDAARMVTINGQLTPTITMQPGEVQRWRIVQGGFHDYTLLALDGHVLHEIAADGIALPAVNPQERMLMCPANAPTCWCRPGARARMPCAVCPTTRARGAAAAGPRAGRRGGGAAGDASADRTAPAAARVDQRRRADGQARADLLGLRAPRPGTISASSASWSTAASSVPDWIGQRIALGAVEEWTITNLHDADHPYHIHTNPFQVTRSTDRR